MDVEDNSYNKLKFVLHNYHIYYVTPSNFLHFFEDKLIYSILENKFLVSTLPHLLSLFFSPNFP